MISDRSNLKSIIDDAQRETPQSVGDEKAT